MDSAPLKVPGFGLPINYLPDGEYFPSAIIDVSHSYSLAQGDAVTVRELIMLHLMNIITDKPEWDSKVFRKDLIQKWSEEARKQDTMDITDKMLDYCFAELQFKALSFQRTGMIASLDCGPAVVKSDNIIEVKTTEALKIACSALETVLDKDWHPGSDQKVLNLVHPSLFPLIYGRSRVLTSGSVDLERLDNFVGRGQLLDTLDEDAVWEFADDIYEFSNIDQLTKCLMPKNLWSRDFQWLPCEVRFLKDERIKISSYINNLHPQRHKELYVLLERVIARSIPLWDEVLSLVKGRHIPRIEMDCTEYDWPQGEAFPDGWAIPEDQLEDYDELDEYSKRDCWEKTTRVLKMPEPGNFDPTERAIAGRVDLRARFAAQGLQIIVKLANIELNPDQPEYKGGSWHVEGQMNERICASALFYYDSHNITESYLEFRRQLDCDDIQQKSYDQHDHEGIEQIYGIEQYGPTMQDLGRVLTREGRLLAFSNILQHRVSPFRLADSSKPGHRKLLALFLVDPHVRILSTANIPPQQRSWLSPETVETTQSLLQRTAELPNELVDKLLPHISDSTMTLEEAKEIRLQLMEERSAFVHNMNGHMQTTTAFNFCEH